MQRNKFNSVGIYPSLRAYFGLATALELRSAEGARFSEQREYDRSVGLELENRKLGDAEKLLFWGGKLLEDKKYEATFFSEGRFRIGIWALLLVAFLSGSLSSYAVFFYDGTTPVNVLSVLLAFVILPLVLLALSIFVLLPPGIFNWGILNCLPFVADFRESIAMLSPGQFVHVLLKRTPNKFSETVEGAFSDSMRMRRLRGAVERSLILFVGQIFAVWFFIGVLISSMYLVVTSDLAFGWSTTLDVEASELHEVTSLIAAPWRRFAPHAEPREELLEISRFFRLGEGVIKGESAATPLDPAVLGEWWPFLLLAILVYALLPRILLYAVARSRLRSVLGSSGLLLPGADLVLQNMNSALVMTSGGQTGAEEPLVASGEEYLSGELPLGTCVLVRWAGREGEVERLRETFRAKGLSVNEVYEAGGSVSIEQESRLPKQIAAVDSSHAIIVMVNGWEPPTAELLDFLTALRGELGDGRSVFLLPFALDNSPTVLKWAVWKRALNSLSDPWFLLLEHSFEESKSGATS